MTHDELIDFVNKDIDQGSLAVLEWFPARSLFALRAVIKLHYPVPYPDWVPTENKETCNRCAGPYPCPTIKAITEELE